MIFGTLKVVPIYAYLSAYQVGILVGGHWIFTLRVLVKKILHYHLT